jgi:RNA polymerase sigma-70 factor, ECF subfamily
MSSQASDLLRELGSGDQDAASRLLPVVYKELRRLAAHYMRAEQSGQTIQPTELVHEAYLQLVGQERISWQGRSHFMAMAATSMRRILVDRARRKSAEKRGAGGEKLSLDDVAVFAPEKSSHLLALDELWTSSPVFPPGNAASWNSGILQASTSRRSPDWKASLSEP